MKIQVNSDKEVRTDAEFQRFAKETVGRTLQRFEKQLTRVEVHLSDVNSTKPGPRDKRCLLEARPARQKPVSVTQTASTVERALQGAARKMSRLLTTSFGKLEVRGLQALRNRKTGRAQPLKSRKKASRLAVKKASKSRPVRATKAVQKPAKKNRR